MHSNFSINKIIIMIAKIIGAISFSSLIYSFCKNISMADIKIAIAFLEAKFFGLFIIDYEVAYISKYGSKLERKIQYFFGDPYVSEILSKYKFSLYESLLLALFMLLVIFVLLGHLWFEVKEITANQSINKNNTSSQANITAYPLAKRKNKQSTEFEDI